MTRHVLQRGALLLGLLLPLASCGDSTGPRPASDLTILQVAATAPPLEQTELSFYAVNGQGREGILYFQDGAGGRGEEYLRLTFDNQSLVTDASGSPVAPGDSVLITVRVVDVTKVQFQFEPSGIVFNPAHMPELRIRYDQADHDFNHDGSEDSEDALIETRLSLWRQESIGGTYVKLPSILSVGLDEVEGLLPGFSRYAIAY